MDHVRILGTLETDMAAHVEQWMMPYLTGRCFDWALALADLIENPVFVAVGNPDRPDHVGLLVDGMYADVRGLLDKKDFLTLNPNGIPPANWQDCDVEVIDRSVVELHAGVAGIEPPYEGCEDIDEARDAVEQAEAGGYLDWLDEEPVAPVP